MIDGNPQFGPVMVNAFRAMAVVMIPVITTFPAAMLCYWVSYELGQSTSTKCCFLTPSHCDTYKVPNNFITLGQSIFLRNSFVKKQLGIWDRPKPVPGQNNDANLQETMNNLVKKVKGEPTTEAEKIKRHNEEVETKKRVQALSKAAKERRR